jgi:hypothetical protein
MTEQDKADFHARLTQLEVGQSNLEMEMKTNTRLTNGLQEDVTKVVSILDTAEAGFKVLGVMGNVIKWTASIVAAVGAVWAAFHNGGPK